MVRIGLISDTHGLLRPEAVDFLCGSDLIIHAGDIGAATILAALASIAPVTAVRGNNDRDAWDHLRDEEQLQVEDVLIHAVHDADELRGRSLPSGVRVVVAGHSHTPTVVERAGVLFVNPGSAGPRRFRLPVSVGELIVHGSSVSARTVELNTASIRL